MKNATHTKPFSALNNNKERLNPSKRITPPSLSAMLGGLLVVLGLLVACPSSISGGGGDNANGTDGNGSSKYVCKHGTPADGDATADNITKCAECNGGFKLHNEQCTATKYTCDHGTPAPGKPSGNVDEAKCASCNDGYTPQGTTACVRAGQYFCTNGTPRSGNTGSTEAVHECLSCFQGYKKLANNQCSRTEFTCTNGTPTDGNPTTGNEDVESCKSCSSGYKHVNNQCTRTRFTCTNGTPTDGNPTTGNEDVESCKSCSSGYKHINNQCNRIEYTCSNGTPTKGNPMTGNEDVESCQSCVIGYFLVGIMCSKDADMDGDGIYNTVDSCPTGASGWTSTNVTDSDGDGCRDSALLSATEINDTSLLTGGGDAVALTTNDSFGGSLASLGDLDGSGPGAVTLAVGAWGDDTGGSGRGAIYLLNLNSSGGILGVIEINDNSKLTNGTDAIDLSDYDFFGASVASLGDVDGSGAGAVTLAVGASDKDTGGTDRGAVYLLNLSRSGGILGVVEINDNSTLTDNTDAIDLINHGYFGISVASLGDVDGTGAGTVTLAVGANKDNTEGGTGMVHLINLNSSFQILSTTEIHNNSTLTNGTDAITVNYGDLFGVSLASLGDLDGMGGGVVTLAVGARGDDAGGAGRGAVHLINLNSSFQILNTTEINDTSLLAGGGDAITLVNKDFFGTSVASLGDLDGMGAGVLTLAVGAYTDDAGGEDQGAVHLINLNSSFQIVNTTEINDTSLLAEGGDAITTHYGDMFGSSLTSLGDLDGTGSGVTTLAIGAHWDNTGGSDYGTAHIITLDIIEEWD